MEIKFRIEGMDKLSATLKNAEKQLRYAAARAATQTAVKVKEQLVKEMQEVFSKPTPFTLRSIYVLPATKDNLTAEVGLKDQAVKYLRPQIEGGTREKKRSEKWLNSFYTPGAAMPLNAYGNITPGRITQILSVTKTHPDIYSRTTSRSKKRNKALPIYFIKRDKTGKLIPGVWQRVGKRKVRPKLIFIDNPQYHKRFDFYGIGQRTAIREFKRIFDAAIADAIRTAR